MTCEHLTRGQGNTAISKRHINGDRDALRTHLAGRAAGQRPSERFVRVLAIIGSGVKATRGEARPPTCLQTCLGLLLGRGCLDAGRHISSRNLRATREPRRRFSALYTTPMPPPASLSRMRQCPTVRPTMGGPYFRSNLRPTCADKSTRAPITPMTHPSIHGVHSRGSRREEGLRSSELAPKPLNVAIDVGNSPCIQLTALRHLGVSLREIGGGCPE